VALGSVMPEGTVPASLEELVVAMLGKSPPLRPTAGQLVERLEAIAAEGGAAGRSLRTLERTSRRPDPGAVTLPMDLDDPSTVALGVEGAVDDELRLALATSNIRVTTADDPAVAAIYAPGASLDRLRVLAAGPRPVLTDLDAADFTALAALVRAGCHDAVTRPVRPADLARKVRRAWLGQRPVTP
jgi:hypothetical protein